MSSVYHPIIFHMLKVWEPHRNCIKRSSFRGSSFMEMRAQKGSLAPWTCMKHYLLHEDPTRSCPLLTRKEPSSRSDCANTDLCTSASRTTGRQFLVFKQSTCTVLTSLYSIISVVADPKQGQTRVTDWPQGCSLQCEMYAAAAKLAWYHP